MWANIDASKKQIGDFILVQKTNNFETKFIEKQWLRSGSDSIVIFQNGKLKYAFFPIKNFSGITEGVGVFQLDITDYNHNATKAGKGIVAVTILMVLFMLIFTAFLIRKAVLNRVFQVDETLKNLSKGKTINPIPNDCSDELGQMIKASNILNDRLKQLSELAQQIGNGNFDVKIEAASNEDILGLAIIDMKKSLKSYSEEMEQKVKKRTEELHLKNAELQLQQQEIKEKNEELNQQNEEIKAINENIKLQGEKISNQNKELIKKEQKLLEANEELQQQNKEITTINEAIIDKSKEIEQKSIELEQVQQIMKFKNFELENALGLLKEQKELIERKNRDITGSLNYARRIQKAILGTTEAITQHFTEAFIYFEPHSIVSGDFFWFSNIEEENLKILITADCTGHGVPGAFMTVIGHNFLDEIVMGNKITEPSQVLYELDKKKIKTLKNNANQEVNDGMDLSVLVFNTQTNEMQFSGAKSTMFVFRGDNQKEIKGSIFPIGGNSFRKKEDKKFKTIKCDLQKNDMVYTFSDGFQDQFGGEDGRKYMKKRFRKFLKSISKLDTRTQKLVIEKEHIVWRGDRHQTDDMLIIGIRI